MSRVLPIVTSVFVLVTGCSSRRYQFRDLGQVAVGLNNREVIPADPSKTTGRLGGSTITRTTTDVLVDGHAVVEDRGVKLNHDTKWSGADDVD